MVQAFITSSHIIYEMQDFSDFFKIPANNLPAQSCGQANTVIMWHDINDDGKADYKATYVFKEGKLHRLDSSQAAQDELGYFIKER